MNPELFHTEHILYMVITTILLLGTLILVKIFVKKEKHILIILKCFAGALLLSIMTNRFCNSFDGDKFLFYKLIPDSYCGMTSLILSLSILIGKKDNPVYHFVWLSGLFGGIATVIYPLFITYHSSFFHPTTISGLLHHSFTAMLVIGLLLFKQINITYKKWYYVVLGFTCYITVGAFLMSVFKVSDAYHIVEPLLSGTPLTVWVMAPIYIFAHGMIFLIIELVRLIIRKKQKEHANE